MFQRIKKKDLLAEIKQLRSDLELVHDRTLALSKLVGKESAARLKEDYKLKNMIKTSSK